MDQSAEKNNSDKAKGERLKYIFDSLSKEKKRFDKILSVRKLSAEEAREFDEICSKLKSFYVKCSPFIKSRKNGPGKFQVDAYVIWAKTNQSISINSSLSTPVEGSFYGKYEQYSGFPGQESNGSSLESKQSKSNNEINSGSDLASSYGPDNMQIKQQHVRMPVIQQFNHNAGPFQNPLASPRIFQGSPSIQQYPGVSPYHQQNPLAQQYPLASSPRQFPRANSQFSRSPMPSDTRRNGLPFTAVELEAKRMPPMTPSFRFDENPFVNQDNVLKQPSIDEINSSRNQLKGQPNNSQLFREGQPQSSRENSFTNQPIMMRKPVPRSDFRPNVFDPRAPNMEMFRNQPMHRNFNPEFRKEQVIAWEDIVPLGAKDLDVNTSNSTTVPVSKNLNSPRKAQNPAENPRFNEFNLPPRFMPIQKGFQNYSAEPSMDLNYRGPTPSAHINPLPNDVAAQRNASNSEIPGKYRPNPLERPIHFPGHLKNHLVRPNQLPREHNNGFPLPPNHYPGNPNKIAHIENGFTSNVIRAARRVAPPEMLSPVGQFNNRPIEILPDFNRVYYKAEDKIESPNKYSELPTFVLGEKSKNPGSFLINLKCIDSIKPKPELAFLDRKPFESISDDSNVSSECLAKMDALLHKTLLIGCMLASARKEGCAINSKDIELAFSKAVAKDFPSKKI